MTRVQGDEGRWCDTPPLRRHLCEIELDLDVTKHIQAGQTARGSRTGGLVHAEAPIHVSNVAVVDPDKKVPTRVKTRVETVERDGRVKTVRTRVAVRSGKDL